MKKYLFLTLLLGIFYNSNAEEFLGTVISYKAIKPNEYRVVYKVYSDILPDNKNYDFTKLKPFTFKLISGKNTVLNFPKLVKSDTVYKNVLKPNRGLVTCVYEDTIDLNDSKYSTIINSGDCKIYFCFYYPERYKTLANIGQSSYFTYSYTNNCISSSNSSPEGSEYLMNLAGKRWSLLNYSFSDMANLDSIAFNFSTPQYGFDSSLIFNSGYTVNKPIDADTIFLNGNTGDIVIAMSIINKNYCLAYQVADYRKIGNKYFETGRVNVDLIEKVIEPFNYFPSVISSSFKYTINAGDTICFDISTDEKIFVPPSPFISEPPDSVNLMWNRGIPGATFTLYNSDDRLPSAKFCWATRENQGSDLPYTFIVIASDNYWLHRDETHIAFSIKVKKNPNGVSGVNKNKISIMPNPSSGDILKITGFAIEEVQIVSTTGKLVSKNKFTPTNEVEQNIASLSPGIYIIQLQANGSFYRVKWVKN